MEVSLPLSVFHLRTILGAIEVSGEFVNYIFRIPSGYISDKI